MLNRPSVVDIDSNEFDSFGFNSTKKGFYNAVDPVTAIAQGVGKIADSVGDVATARSNRKVAESKLAELGGKRSAQLIDCENNTAFKKFADPKYRRNRINECQAEVKKRLDFEEAEQREIVRKSLEIEQGKIANQRSGAESSNKMKYILVGVGIISLTIFFITKKNK